MQRNTLVIVAAMFVVGPVAAESIVDKAERDELYMVAEADPAMESAFTKARASLADFLARWREPLPTDDSFSVKIAVVDGDSTEYFWVGLDGESGDQLVGTIDNMPQIVSTVRMGDRVEIDREDIVDWTYTADGRMQGNFTACAMLVNESAAERASFAQRFGLTCED